ncbi:hypothetical protein FACS189440_18870 [Bacteroidia bacterium]|nr:hypothetical protein FACS189440_18870 [Bacteroidia bacterium]
MQMERNIKYNKISYWLSIVCFAFGLSWLSQLLISFVLGNNFFEPFLVIAFFFIIASRHPVGNILKKSLQSKSFLIFFLIISIFGLIGFFNSGYDFMSVYGDYRVNLLFIFTILFFLSKKWTDSVKEKFIIHLFIVISIFDVLALTLRPYLWIESTKQNIGIIIPAVLAVYYMRKNKYLYSFIFTAILSYDAILSFFRKNYLFAMIIFVIIFVLFLQNLAKGKTNIKNKMKSMFLIFSIIIVGLYSSDAVYSYWMSNESKMIHSIVRTEELLSGDSEEVERKNSLLVILNYPERLLFPQGLGWRAFIDDVEKEFRDLHIVSSMDSSPFYIGYHYGIIILVFLFFIAVKHIFYAFFQRDKFKGAYIFNKMVRIAFFGIFCISFFTESVMFTLSQAAFAYATLYSLILKPI